MTEKPRKTATVKWPRPWDPPVLDESEIRAFKSLAAGNANDAQQMRVLNVILHKFARVNQPAYWPDSDSGTNFAEGKRFVGLQILGALNMAVPERKPQG